MEWPKPLLIKFGIHHRLECCVVVEWWKEIINKTKFSHNPLTSKSKSWILVDLGKFWGILKYELQEAKESFASPNQSKMTKSMQKIYFYYISYFW